MFGFCFGVAIVFGGLGWFFLGGGGWGGGGGVVLGLFCCCCFLGFLEGRLFFFCLFGFLGVFLVFYKFCCPLPE